MQKIVVCSIMFCLVGSTLPQTAFAHGGGLNASGCHNNRKTGGYHCHRSSYKPKTTYRPPATYTPPTATPPTSNINPYAKSSIYQNQSAVTDSSKIYVIQALLKHLGYDVGSTDGILGQTTVNAIKKFQRDQNIIVNGIPSDSLIYELSRGLALLEH